jgi:two-component sensor histidine kinase
MDLFRGIHARILLTLLVFELPALAFSVFWVVDRQIELRAVEREGAREATELSGAALESVRDRADAIRIKLDNLLKGTGGNEGCGTGLSDVVSKYASFDAAALYRDQSPLCDYRALPVPPDALVALQQQLAAGQAVGIDSVDRLITNATPDILLALKLDPSGMILLLRLSRPALDRILDPLQSGALSRLSLVRPGSPTAAQKILLDRRNAKLLAFARQDGTLPDVLAAPVSTKRVWQLQDERGDTLDGFAIQPISDSPVLIVGLADMPTSASYSWRLWVSMVQLLALVVGPFAGFAWGIDRFVLRWIDYLGRIARAHGRGRHSLRAKRLDRAPEEIRRLGQSLNQMADDAGLRVASIRASAAEKSALLLELHHRVKNNFQVITSLLSLHKKSLPAERQSDIRFIEDHIQSMAVAYRVAYDSNDIASVRLGELLYNVVDSLREVASVPSQQIALTLDGGTLKIGLDKAISLGLYLAALLPPRLDRLTASGKIVRIGVHVEQRSILLSVSGDDAALESPSTLRRRLVQAYIRQLKATPIESHGDAPSIISIPLE